MSGPLLFFILIIAIDLILKSSKDKKKIEAKKSNRIETREEIPNTRRSIMSTLKEEIEKERQKEIQRRQQKTKPLQNLETKVVKEKKRSRLYEEKEYKNYKRSLDISTDKENDEQIKENNITIDSREDIIKGIIFSEILSEPKSIKNQRRSI